MNRYMHTRLLLRRLASFIPKSLSTKSEYSLGDRVHSQGPHTLQSRLIEYFEKTVGASQNHTKNVTFVNAVNLSKYNIAKHQRTREDSTERNLPNCQMINNGNEFESINTNVTTVGNISSMMNAMQSLDNARNPKDAMYLLSEIDKQCCNVLNTLSCSDILMLLNTLTKIIPQRITETFFYRRSIEELKQALMKESLSRREILHSIFLVGFKKKSGARDMKTILTCLPKENELTLIELCIVAQSAFKTGVKLAPKIVKAIEDIIEKDAKYLVHDQPMLVTLSKALRHAGPTGEHFLDNLSKQLITIERKYELPAAVHVLALYAEIYTAEENVLRRLVNDSISSLKSRNKIKKNDKRQYFSETIRIKDVDRLLWAVSRFNYDLKECEFLEIDEFIKERWNEFSKKPALLVGTLLSLWMLGHKCEKAIENCFHENLFAPLLKSERWKYKARLNLLLTCVRIEAPQISIPAELITETHIGWKRRINIDVVKNALSCLASHIRFDDIKVDCPVRGLYVPGVSANHSHLGWIHIDVLDESTCLRNTWKPHGLVVLKLRLLKELGYCSLQLRDDCLENSETTYTTIEDTIDNELRIRGMKR